jgi:hypothetical protein
LPTEHVHHTPTEADALAIAKLRKQQKALTSAISRLIPESRERSTALTRADEALMWAEKAVVCNGTAMAPAPPVAAAPARRRRVPAKV